MKKSFIILSTLFVFYIRGYAQISLVKDFDNVTIQGSSGLDAIFGATLNGYTYYSDLDEHGMELWRTDGTPSGTHLFVDIMPGDFQSDPQNFTKVNNRIVFTATDNVHGREVWVTNGTLTGTEFLRDINPGVEGSYPSNFLLVGNLVYFLAYTSTNSVELWRTDGSDIGTIMVKDFYAGQFGPGLNTELAEMNGLVYFSGSDSELWKSDGTVNGTVLVKDINPGDPTSNPHNFFSANGKLYFSADDGIHGKEAWVSDGTAAGTVLLKDVASGTSDSDPANFTASGNILLFSANDNINGEEIWATDGTETGTHLLLDINSGNTGSDPKNFKALGSNILFSATTFASGRELYTSDGTTGGTHIIVEMDPGTGDGCSEYPEHPVIYNNEYYFLGNDVTHGFELWKTDGTAAGTSLVIDLNPGTGSGTGMPLYATTSYLYFAGTNASFGRLYTYNGSGIVAISPANDVALSGSPEQTHLSGSTIYLDAFVEGTGTVLFKSDGTTAGTTVLLNNSAEYVPAAFHFTDINGGITLFSTYSGSYVNNIYRTNGTQAGTFPLIDTYINAPDNAYILGKYNDKVLFSALSPTYNQELYITDGTIAGTTLLKDIEPGTGPSTPSGGVQYNGYYYFCATQNGSTGLWRTDGTTAGTTLFFNVNPIGDGDAPGNFRIINGKLFFIGSNGQGAEPWISDGTVTGTHIILDINPDGSESSFPHFLGQDNTFLYFQANDEIHGAELWRSDGTTAGTIMMQDINPGVQSSNPTTLFIKNGNLYFNANDGVHGAELWKSGTGANEAAMLIDILPGKGSSDAGPLDIINDTLYFQANNNTLGTELWATDGTANGTVICGDLMPGSPGSHPYFDVVLNDELYFTAKNNVYGIEFWKYKPQSPVLPIIRQTLSNCKGYYSPMSGKLYFENAMEIDTLQGANTIDSAIVYTNIIINNPSYRTDVRNACDAFTWINNVTYTSSVNTPTVHLFTTNGCDSIITLNLTIHGSPTATIVNDQQGTLSASGGYWYQWYQCFGNSFSSIASYDSIFTPTETGSYCCVVRNIYGCSDTTTCEEVNVDASLAIHLMDEIHLYPNPTVDFVQIDLPENETFFLAIFDSKGIRLAKMELQQSEKIDLSRFAEGIYTFQIQSAHGSASTKVVKIE